MNTLTKTRAIYSISLAGFALTSVGCGDPIIDDPIVDPIIADLTVVTILDIPTPSIASWILPLTSPIPIHTT
jgi:hypothetical protein